MTEKKIEEFANDFYSQYGIQLENAISGNQPNKVMAFVNRIERVVYEEIKERCPTFRPEKLSEMQLNAIWRACLEQAYYMLNNYDMNIFSGIDPVSSVVIPIEEIRKRSFSALAKRILLNAGLFYAGIYRRTSTGMPFTTFWES